MGYNPSVHGETVENDYGPAFEIESGLGDNLTIWFEKTEWEDDRTRGRKLTPTQARDMAKKLERMAQQEEPLSHSE